MSFYAATGHPKDRTAIERSRVAKNVRANKKDFRVAAQAVTQRKVCGNSAASNNGVGAL